MTANTTGATNARREHWLELVKFSSNKVNAIRAANKLAKQDGVTLEEALKHLLASERITQWRYNNLMQGD